MADLTVYQAIGAAYKTVASTSFEKTGTVSTGRSSSYKFVFVG